MKKPTLFQERLAPCQEELRGLYTSLYGEDEQAYSYFLEMLKSSLAQRKSALRRLDENKILLIVVTLGAGGSFSGWGMIPAGCPLSRFR